MKIIFLDVDGVLNSPHTWSKFFPHPPDAVDRDKVARVWSLCMQTDALVVFSTAWRTHWTLTELKAFLVEKGWPDDGRILDTTPHRHRTLIPRAGDSASPDEYFSPEAVGAYAAANPLRGTEVQAWLDVHPDVTHYVILDDMGPEQFPQCCDTNFVQTNWRIGITDADVIKAVSILS